MDVRSSFLPAQSLSEKACREWWVWQWRKTPYETVSLRYRNICVLMSFSWLLHSHEFQLVALQWVLAYVYFSLVKDQYCKLPSTFRSKVVSTCLVPSSRVRKVENAIGVMTSLEFDILVWSRISRIYWC